MDVDRITGTGDSAAPSLFIVRVDGDSAACRWEIRRFGAIVLSRSRTLFLDAEAARRDGEEALARWWAGVDRPDASPGDAA